MVGAPVKEDLVNDGWTEAFRTLFSGVRDLAPAKWRIGFWALFAPLNRDFYKLGLKQYVTKKVTDYMDLSRQIEIADFKKMEGIRARADEVVKDKVTAEALKPYYRQFCKRPCFHDEYLNTFNSCLLYTSDAAAE